MLYTVKLKYGHITAIYIVEMSSELYNQMCHAQYTYTPAKDLVAKATCTHTIAQVVSYMTICIELAQVCHNGFRAANRDGGEEGGELGNETYSRHVQ